MLIDFQQALADLLATPELCRLVRADPTALDARYRLSERERARLIGIARDRGMRCNCMLYRANRLAPITTHVPALCTALGARFAPLLHEYWASQPGVNPHVLLETRAFCEFLASEALPGGPLPEAARAEVARATADLDTRIAAALD